LPGNARICNYNWFRVVLSLHYHQKQSIFPGKNPWSIIPEKRESIIPEKKNGLSTPEKTQVINQVPRSIEKWYSAKSYDPEVTPSAQF
jgi:hypothetical protein